MLKTGQTTCYNQSGGVVNDDSIKDDGFYQKGTTRAYTRANDIVTDNVTHLMWQDDSDAANTWDGNISYCKNLNLGGYRDWRLPAIEELVFLTDKSKNNLTIDLTFENIDSVTYKSSTVFLPYPPYTWHVDFSDGDDYWSGGLNLRCVRNGEFDLTKVDYIHDDSKGVVIDTSTNLMWQDDVPSVQKTWIEAINYCENLTIDSYDDWRLPNFNELYMLIDRRIEYHPISLAFHYVNDDKYWSSTTYAVHTNIAWGVYFNGGPDSLYDKSSIINVRCVRDDN